MGRALVARDGRVGDERGGISRVYGAFDRSICSPCATALIVVTDAGLLEDLQGMPRLVVLFVATALRGGQRMGR
jgi:hypothetical protein